jgi:hypothetical protein
MLANSDAVTTTKLKSNEALPKMGAVCVQWKRCGRAGCRCGRGELHGPYYCRFWRAHGRLRKQYVRLANAQPAQAACRARREQDREQREVARQARAEWRALKAHLREIERLWGL